MTFTCFEGFVPLIDLVNAPWFMGFLRRYEVLIGSSPLQTVLRRNGLIMREVCGGFVD